MPAFSSDHPWYGSVDYFYRVPTCDPNATTSEPSEPVQESQAEINNRVFDQLLSDKNFVKVLNFNGCDVIIGAGNSSAEISIFFHDQRPWESRYNDLPIPHSWRDQEWHQWFDAQVYKLIFQ